MPHDNYIPSTLLLLTKFLLTLSRSTKIKNDSQRTSLCSALCHPIVSSLHFATSCVVLASSRSNQPRICASLAFAVRLVTCAAPTSRELSRGALDDSASSLEFEHPASSVEWPDLAARTPQHLSPVHRTPVQPLRSPRLSLETPAILHQTLRSTSAFIIRSPTLKRPSSSLGR